MWKNILERGRPQTTIWCMRIACWIPKAINTHTHSGCVILTTFPLQQWLHGRASMLRNTHIACPLSDVCSNAFDRYILNLLPTQSSRDIFRQLLDTRVTITQTTCE